MVGIDSVDELRTLCPENVRKILFIAKYMVDDAVISGYQLMSIDRLMVFLLLNGEDWRSHSCKAFQYFDGCWEESDRVVMPSLDLLTAIEGLFIALTSIENLPWSWKSVKKNVKI